MTKAACECLVLRPEGTFDSSNDYRRFEGEITKSPAFIEIAVCDGRYADLNLEERWFRCASCGKVWRLVEPDAPFRGTWEEVTTDESAMIDSSQM